MKTNLKKIRKNAGWSNAEDFAASIGMSAKTYRNYEQGVRGMGLDVAAELCNALGCSINDLITVEEDDMTLSAQPYLEKVADGTSSDEGEILGLYRKMDDTCKIALITIAKMFLEDAESGYMPVISRGKLEDTTAGKVVRLMHPDELKEDI